MALLCACTINHYHVGAYKPDAVDNSLLVIPELTTAKNGAQKGLPGNPATVSKQAHTANAVGHKNSESATPDQVLVMFAKGSGDNDSVQYLDSVSLEVQSNVDAYLNCYHKQADGDIIKVFPNRYARRYWVYASQQLTFPNEKYFKFLANSAGSSEGFICLLSQEDVLGKLPKEYQALVFQKLPVKNFDAVYALYKQTTDENLVARVVSYTIGQ